MFWALSLRMSVTVSSSLALLVVLAAGVGFLVVRRLRGGAERGVLQTRTVLSSRDPIGDRAMSWLCLAALGCLWLSALTVTLYWPIWTWDALAMFDYRGRVIAATGSLDFLRREYWGTFPLLTSLAHALVYTLGGSAPQAIYPLYYLSLLIVVYENVKSISGRLVAAVTSLILGSTPIVWTHATEAFTNLP